jgi:hypothetical protein
MTPGTHWGAWHGLISGEDPFDGLSEGRQLARLDEMKELLTGDVGARPVRHRDSEVSDELETQAVAVIRMQKNSKLKGQARERRSR